MKSKPSLFKYKKVNKYVYHVETKNGMHIANIEQDVDGYFYFWMDSGMNGAWTSQILREVANKLDELNKEWNTIIDRDIGGKDE